MKKTIVNSCALLVASTLGQMAKATVPNDLPAYGMSGCGLGALLVDEYGQVPQIGSAIINELTSGTRTFAISTGSSNCVETPAKFTENESKIFFSANLRALEQDASQGQGETFSSLAELFGCASIAGESQLAKLSQKHYAELYKTRDPEEVLQRYRELVQRDPSLSKSCAIST